MTCGKVRRLNFLGAVEHGTDCKWSVLCQVSKENRYYDELQINLRKNLVQIIRK